MLERIIHETQAKHSSHELTQLDLIWFERKFLQKNKVNQDNQNLEMGKGKKV